MTLWQSYLIVGGLILLVSVGTMPTVIADQSGELIQNGGFESGTAGWQTQGTVAPASRSTYEPGHSGSKTCRIGDYRTGTGGLWQTVQLPRGAKAAVSFWSRVEKGTTLSVSLTAADGSQINSWSFGGSQNPQWTRSTYEIKPDYGGQAITMKFTGQAWGEVSCGYTIVCPYGYGGYYYDYCYWTYVCNDYVYYYPYIDDASIYYTIVKYAVDVSVEGLSGPSTTTVFVDDVASANLGNGQKKTFTFDLGTQHSISADGIIPGQQGVRYVLNDKNPISVSSDGSFVLKYSTQFYLEASSSLGSVTGTGWYDAGSNVPVNVSPTSVSMEGITGAIGAVYSFDHWSGTTSSDPSATVLMDSPKKIDAVWRQDYQSFYRNIIIMITTNMVVIVALIVWRQKHPAKTGTTHETSSTVRICPSCGYSLSRLPTDIQKCPFCAHDLK